MSGGRESFRSAGVLPSPRWSAPGPVGDWLGWEVSPGQRRGSNGDGCTQSVKCCRPTSSGFGQPIREARHGSAKYLLHAAC